MTYSILGYDASNGDLGVAVQSKFPGVGSLVPYGEAEVGVVATQGFGNPATRICGLATPEMRRHPRQAVEVLLNDDSLSHKRQFALVDGKGAVAAHTGADLHTWDGWAGSTAGHACIALGNGLASNDVVDHMVRTFESSRAPLAERLMTTLASGEHAGGDIRGQQSAALLVLRRNGGYGALDDRHVVISIYDHEQPIERVGAVLRACSSVSRSCGAKVLRHYLAKSEARQVAFDEPLPSNPRRGGRRQRPSGAQILLSI